MATNKQRVIVGLSGGVDSAVTAYLLKQQGHEVIGIFMKNCEDDDDSEYCSSNVDFVDAAAVADVIGIEIEHVNFAAEYRDRWANYKKPKCVVLPKKLAYPMPRKKILPASVLLVNVPSASF